MQQACRLLPCLVLCLLCLLSDRPASLRATNAYPLAAAKAQAAKYTGVCYDKKRRIFVANTRIEGIQHYIGSFKTAKQAAEAYDAKLRSLLSDEKHRLKKYLNFPSKAEASFSETLLQARQRGLRGCGRNSEREAMSFKLLDAAIDASSYVDGFEIARLTGASRADAVFRPRGSGGAGLLIQVKASMSVGKRSRRYQFNGLLGYEGVLVILVALDGGHIWAAAGSQLLRRKLWITVGCASDCRYAVPDIGQRLVECFHCRSFQHMSAQEARLQCTAASKVEVYAHDQLDLLLNCVNMTLCQPRVHQTAVDSLLEVPNPDVPTEKVRVQEKASHRDKRDARYRCVLGRRAGVLGLRAYATDNFDLLAVSLLDAKQLQGVFLIPMSVLRSRGLVGRKHVTLMVHPPWSQPKRNTTRVKYSWQEEYFLDLRAWNQSLEVPQHMQMRLQDLIQNCLAAMSVKNAV